MKLPLPCLLAALSSGLLLCAPATLRAEDKEKPVTIDKSTTDKAKDMLEKLVGEVKDAASKSDTKSSKGGGLWERSKETLALSKADYLKKATSALATMDVEVQGLADSGAAVVSRDYFKTRIDSLKQHLDYCKRDLTRLQETPTEEAFRVKQKGFDRGLDFLGNNIELAKEEAGL